ncbi:MAG: HAD hydrolase-like protein [Acidobacteriota bacterium]|nr:HAD hydrolase-like protein [Acidobacteriota bacterium]
MHLFFDLDGTLTDSGPGIVNCVNHALVELGRRAVPEAEIRAMIGAPLSWIFPRLFGVDDEALVDRAIDAYRERFDQVGVFENQLYPGIADALHALTEGGHRLQVVTAKPAVAARRVVEHFRIDHHFVALHGPALDQRTCDKADLVAAALRHAGGPDDAVVLIGDRRDDVLAARAHGVTAVGAGWGYGTADELAAAGAAFVARDVAALMEWLRT